MDRILYTILKIYIFAYLMRTGAIQCIVCACVRMSFVCFRFFSALTIFGPDMGKLIIFQKSNIKSDSSVYAASKKRECKRFDLKI